MEKKNPGSSDYSLNSTTNGTNTNNTLTLGMNYDYYGNYHNLRYYYVPQQPYYVPQLIDYPIYVPQPALPTYAPVYPTQRLPLSMKPTVHITAGKSRVKLFGNNVYMPDNTDFEIELFNPSNETLGVKFKMNGQYISENMLVLYPGKHMFLDRYLNENRKFKYITYEINDNKESLDAVANNGNIQVEFYRERLITNNNNSLNLNGLTSGSNNTTIGTVFNYNSSSDTVNLADLQPSNNTFYCASTNFGTSFGNTLDSVLTTATSNIGGTTKDWLSEETTKEFNEIETGMIAKGGKSETEFNDVDINFELSYTQKFEFKILPLSQKPIEPKDLVIQCKNCKKKAKRGDNYCSGCSAKL